MIQRARYGAVERRRYKRCDVQGAVQYSWAKAGKVQHDFQSTVRNLSAGGIFVSTADPPPVGTCVHLHLLFSAFLSGSRLLMDATAQVVRLELEADTQTHARAGFAAVLKAYSLRNDEEVVEQEGALSQGCAWDA